MGMSPIGRDRGVSLSLGEQIFTDIDIWEADFGFGKHPESEKKRCSTTSVKVPFSVE